MGTFVPSRYSARLNTTLVVSDNERKKIPIGSTLTQPYTDGGDPDVFKKIDRDTWKKISGEGFLGVYSVKKDSSGKMPATYLEADFLDDAWLKGYRELPPIDRNHAFSDSKLRPRQDQDDSNKGNKGDEDVVDEENIEEIAATGMSPLVYVGIGVGVLALAGGIYYFGFRKK